MAGSLSGLVGIGGGVIIVPLLVFLFGFSQHQAQGTTLALLVPPIGFFSALTYYRAGFVDVKVAGLLCVGFVLGSFIGARFATETSPVLLEKIFGITIIVIGIKMLW